MRLTNYRPLLVIVLTLAAGFGFALALPWLASAQGKPVEIETGIISKTENKAQGGKRYYVAKTGDGSDGSSWTQAFLNLQDALAEANSNGGGEIWVAEGEYFPDEGTGQSGDDRSSTFELLNDVAIYGGFSGGETELSERDWVTNPTILSGDIDGNDTKVDGVVLTPTNIILNNAYHVVSARNVDRTAVLDGFIITGGKADGSAPDNIGGGFYCDGSGSGSNCSPNLKNLTFSGNTAELGGGMYNGGSNKGSSSPNLEEVNFSGNTAIYGGAMFNAGFERGNSSPVLKGIDFSKNSVTTGDGGAMYNSGGEYGTSSPVMDEVEFFKNFSKGGDGGAMFNSGFPSGASSPNLTKVTFTDNFADNGGALYNDGHDEGDSSPILDEVIFLDNHAQAGGFGGAMYNNGSENGASSPDLNTVEFTGNFVPGDSYGSGAGGGMYNDATENGYSSPTLYDVFFSGNFASADGFGGAMASYASNGGTSSPILERVTFSGNNAFSGGAVWDRADNSSNMSSIKNTAFIGNYAAHGGAVLISCSNGGSNSPEMVNVVFLGNYSTSGGAIQNYATNGTCSLQLTHATISGNQSYWGAVVYNHIELEGVISTTIKNSILWNNLSTEEDGLGVNNFYDFGGDSITYIAHSTVEGSAWVSDPNFIDGGGNIDQNPEFITPVDPLNAPTTEGDLHLNSDSPAIDIGNNDFIPGIFIDMDANPRRVDGDKNGTLIADMGAYEYQIPYLHDGYLPFNYQR